MIYLRSLASSSGGTGNEAQAKSDISNTPSITTSLLTPEDVVDVIHVVSVADPCRMLENPQNDEVLAWAKSQTGSIRTTC